MLYTYIYVLHFIGFWFKTTQFNFIYLESQFSQTCHKTMSTSIQDPVFWIFDAFKCITETQKTQTHIPHQWRFWSIWIFSLLTIIKRKPNILLKIRRCGVIKTKLKGHMIFIRIITWHLLWPSLTSISRLTKLWFSFTIYIRKLYARSHNRLL